MKRFSITNNGYDIDEVNKLLLTQSLKKNLNMK